jgi:uncharacterized SAM-binding protein YcdF (DUF218 family)
MGRWTWCVLILLLALGGGLAPWAVTGLARWLVVADPLTHAQAIVVLGGHLPFRAMEAASLYRQGWAPEVWLTRSSSPAEEGALARLGIRVLGEEHYNRQVLERLGVPTDAIRSLREGAQNTVEEVQLVARELKQVGGGRIILVTSKAHSRRVRATWHALVGDAPHAVVRYATEDSYDPARWWRHTRDALAVSREVFGLLHVWAGVPVRQEGSYRVPLPGRGARCHGNRSRRIRREARLTLCRARDDAA